MNIQPTGKIEKGWGFEIVWASSDKYCAKMLVFERAGARTSLVFHKEKTKSWFVNAGKFKLTFIDIKTGETKEAVLGEGQTADFGPLSPHQLVAMEPNSMIIEVSTPDIVEDRFRLEPGDTQILKQQSDTST